ncbi:MAG: type IV secretion system protein [Candidatus Spechtbacterales bacterium]
MKGIFRPSNFNKNNKPLHRGVFGVLVLLPVLLLLFVPLPASAQEACDGGWFTDFGCNLLAWLIRLGGMFIVILAGAAMFVLGIIVGFAKSVLDLAINMSLSVPYTSGPVIDAAWPVVRDIANMGLILVLIAIGVGTMLSLRSINKRLLIPFFIVAILINFTPLLTGIVIDLANITARIFYDSASAFSNALFNVGLWQNLTDTVGGAWEDSREAFEQAESVGAVLAIMVPIVMNAVFGVIFFIILILTYIILAVLFFVRMFFLWLLVILSPVAFLCYILPSTRKWFQRWLHNFLQWSIIVIPLLFFLWMAGLFANNAELTCTTFIEDGGGSESYGFQIADWGGDTAIGYEVVCKMTTTAMAVFAIAAGIVISTSSSAQGARGIIKWTRKKYDQGVKAVGKKSAAGARAGVGWASRPAREKAAERTGQAGRWLMKGGTGKLAQNKVLGAPIRGASKAMQAPTEKLRKQQAEADKKLAGKKTFEEVLPHLKGGGSYNDQVAALKKAAEHDPDKLAKLMEEDPHMKKRFKSLQKAGKLRQDDAGLKPVLQKLPHLASEELTDEEKREGKKTEKQKTIEGMSTSQLAGMSGESLKDEGVVRAMFDGGKDIDGLLRDIGSNTEKLAGFEEGLEEYMETELKNENTWKDFIAERGDVIHERDAKDDPSVRWVSPSEYMESHYKNYEKAKDGLTPEDFMEYLGTKQTREGLSQADRNLSSSERPHIAAFRQTSESRSGFRRRGTPGERIAMSLPPTERRQLSDDIASAVHEEIDKLDKDVKIGNKRLQEIFNDNAEKIIRDRAPDMKFREGAEITEVGEKETEWLRDFFRRGEGYEEIKKALQDSGRIDN